MLKIPDTAKELYGGMHYFSSAPMYNSLMDEDTESMVVTVQVCLDQSIIQDTACSYRQIMDQKTEMRLFVICTFHSYSFWYQYFRKAMELSESNRPTAITEPDKENTEPEEIYLGADGTEEVAVGKNGKRFKVKYKPFAQVPVLQRNLYNSHMFQLINRY